MDESHEEELNKLNETIIFEIISNKKLKLKDENQLLHVVNKSIKNKRYKSDTPNEGHQSSTITIEYKNGSEFEGIFANLRKITGGNPHDKGLVKVTLKYYHSCQSYFHEESA